MSKSEDNAHYLKYRDYYRAYGAAYRKTAAFKESQRKYNQSAKGWQTRLNYQSRPEVNERRKVEFKDWRSRNKVKIVAHRIFWKAMKAGLLTKEPCFSCGHDPALAHHEHYSFPHRVWWLCDSCHQRHHVSRGT